MTELIEEPKPLDKYVFVTPPKYRLPQEPSYHTQINELAEKGYRVHTISGDFALMSRPQPTKYDGIKNFEQVTDPDRVQELLDNGWTILSETSKFIRMVKRT